jgi:hypothetical protein
MPKALRKLGSCRHACLRAAKPWLSARWADIDAAVVTGTTTAHEEAPRAASALASLKSKMATPIRRKTAIHSSRSPWSSVKQQISSYSLCLWRVEIVNMLARPRCSRTASSSSGTCTTITAEVLWLSGSSPDSSRGGRWAMLRVSVRFSMTHTARRDPPTRHRTCSCSGARRLLPSCCAQDRPRTRSPQTCFGRSRRDTRCRLSGSSRADTSPGRTAAPPGHP